MPAVANKPATATTTGGSPPKATNKPTAGAGPGPVSGPVVSSSSGAGVGVGVDWSYGKEQFELIRARVKFFFEGTYVLG